MTKGTFGSSQKKEIAVDVPAAKPGFSNTPEGESKDAKKHPRVLTHKGWLAH